MIELIGTLGTLVAIEPDRVVACWGCGETADGKPMTVVLVALGYTTTELRFAEPLQAVINAISAAKLSPALASSGDVTIFERPEFLIGQIRELIWGDVTYPPIDSVGQEVRFNNPERTLLRMMKVFRTSMSDMRQWGNRRIRAMSKD